MTAIPPDTAHSAFPGILPEDMGTYTRHAFPRSTSAIASQAEPWSEDSTLHWHTEVPAADPFLRPCDIGGGGISFIDSGG